MCYSENRTRVCGGCPSVISRSKDRHKCFEVLKGDKKFGACGKREGPFKTREKLDNILCDTCTSKAEQEAKSKRESKRDSKRDSSSE